LADSGHAFPGKLVNDAKGPEFPTIIGSIVNEIHAPSVIGMRCRRGHQPASRQTFRVLPLLVQLQTLGPVDPVDAILTDTHPITPEHGRYSSVTKTRAG
jgi:hypothetical protein